MKILTLLLIAFIALSSARKLHWGNFNISMEVDGDDDESRKLSGGRLEAPLRIKQEHNTEKLVSSLAECPWIASIQYANCPRSTYGFNAVYVAGSWVLTNYNIIRDMTDYGAKKKNVVVVSETTNVPWGEDGVVRRVKDIVFEWNYSIALLKVSGEQHDFITVVPPNWEPNPATHHTLYFWEPYSENMDLIENLLIPDQSNCPNGNPSNLCLNKIPLWYYHDIWGAVLVDDQKRLVGMIYDVSDGIPGYYEYLDRASALYQWISSTIRSKDAGNYDNAK